MITVNIQEMKINLSKLLEKVAEGEHVAITDRGKIVAEIIKPKTNVDISKTSDKKSQSLKGLFGSLKGKIHYAEDYDKADEEILEMFEESINKPRLATIYQ